MFCFRLLLGWYPYLISTLYLHRYFFKGVKSRKKHTYVIMFQLQLPFFAMYFLRSGVPGRPWCCWGCFSAIEVEHNGKLSITGLMRSFQRGWLVITLDVTLENKQNKADLTPKESN